MRLLLRAVNSDSRSPPQPPCSLLMEDVLLRYLLLLFISHGLVVFPLSYGFRKLKVISANHSTSEQVDRNLSGHAVCSPGPGRIGTWGPACLVPAGIAALSQDPSPYPRPDFLSALEPSRELGR